MDAYTSCLRSGKGKVTKEHRDYLLIKEVYHCSPEELKKVPEWKLELHFSFLMEERESEFIEQKRATQKAKLSSK